MNEKYDKSNLDVIKDFYPEYYKNKGNNSGIVGWSSKKDQYKRFEILLKAGVEDGDTILDFGSGLAGLYEYMSERYDNFNYIGVDVNDEFIKTCKKKYPDVKFKAIKDISDIKNSYDWFIASGPFTVYTPVKNMLETIKIAVKQAKSGVAVNFLESSYAKNSDLMAIRGYDKKELYKTFVKIFDKTHTIKLVDNYIKNDFTIYIVKK